MIYRNPEAFIKFLFHYCFFEICIRIFRDNLSTEYLACPHGCLLSNGHWKQLGTKTQCPDLLILLLTPNSRLIQWHEQQSLCVEQVSSYLVKTQNLLHLTITEASTRKREEVFNHYTTIFNTHSLQQQKQISRG